MVTEENAPQQIDIYILLEDFLRQVKRFFLLGIVLVVLCSAGLAVKTRSSFVPYYEAYTSFTVRVANPLYGSISSYNERTAQAMADTFPSILTSSLMRSRVMEELDINWVPSMTVTAVAESSILTLTVRDTDPQRAYDVLNAVIACYPEVAEFVLGSTVLVMLDESGLPAAPINSYNLQGNLVKGAMIGLVLWFGLAAVMVLLKNTIHNEDELRRTLNAPCLGQIPSVKISRKMPYPLIHRIKKDAGFSESIRLLRLRVEKAMEDEEKKVLLVSSAIPGEGKTTVSCNLAAALAQKGKNVLLIDCDLRNPSVVNTLGTKNYPLSPQNSLVDYMRGKVTIMEMIQPTEVKNLSIIPGGTGSKSGYSAMLSQERMARLIQAARNLYDYVILDTPPCSLLADAAEVAELAEAGLMVIRQDYAARDQIVDGVQRLSDCKLPIIGCAFNNIRRGSSGASDYYYGYGSYGYGNK